MPRKLVAERDAVLAAVRGDCLEAEEFEELCVLYVALTRARYATYAVVADRNAPTSPAAILRERLAGDGTGDPMTLGGEAIPVLCEYGDRGWFETKRPQAPAAVRPCPAWPAGFAAKESGRPRLIRFEPSKQDVFARNAGRLFDRESTEVVDFGSAIHELFEPIEWIEDADVDAVVEAWEPGSRYDAAVTRDAIEQFRNCVTSETVRECLSKPAGPVDLWREKRFDIVQDGKLVTGVFDRVTVLRDGKGRPVAATILDYKSSRVDAPAQIDRRAEDYTPQMTTYRDALSRILGLDPRKITLLLLFTRQQALRQVGG
jgi:ATP-dependent helicase/nuclease subunit A